MGIVAVSLGSFDIYWYGLLVSLAVVAGLAVLSGQVFLLREDFSRVIDLLLYGIPAALVFGRIFYVLLHWGAYRERPLEILLLHHGGLSIYGAFIGVVFTVFIYARCCQLSFWHWLDILAPALVLGMAILQLGYFVFQLNVGMPVPEESALRSRIVEYVEYAFRPSGFESYEYFKPVALYQAIWQLGVFWLITLATLWQTTRRRWPEGALFLLGMLLLAGGRFCFGFLYLTSDPSRSLHFGQMISLLGCGACGALLAARLRRRGSVRLRL